MGNAISITEDNPFNLVENGTQNLTSLSGKIDTTNYSRQPATSSR